VIGTATTTYHRTAKEHKGQLKTPPNTPTTTKTTRAQLTLRLRQLPKPRTRMAIAAAEASYDTPTAKENMTGRTRRHCRHHIFSPSSVKAEVIASPPHDQGGLHCQRMMPVGTPHHGGFQCRNHNKEALCPRRRTNANSRRGLVAPL
jgi:hypothetical protein